MVNNKHSRTSEFEFIPPVPSKYSTKPTSIRPLISDEDDDRTVYNQRTNDHEMYDMKHPYEEKAYKPYDNYNYNYRTNANENQPFIVDPFQEQRNQKQPHTKSQLHKFLKIPFFTYLVTIVDIIVFIVELVKMAQLTGSPIQTKPYFNPMIGPSTYLQIYIGARFSPCMHYIEDITDVDMDWPCANSTTTATQVCTLAELCNYSSDVTTPHQTWRILSAMFLHAGFVHIIFNLLLQITMGREVEIRIGTIRYFIIYMLSGISGNVFGLNFAGDGVASSGASGALFGIIAVNLILFILHQDRSRVRYYKTILTIMFFEIIVCLVLGLLPGLDNFAHIGGLICGALFGVLLLDNPNFVKINPKFKTKALFSFENIKKKQFWFWTCLRVVCLLLLVAWFVGLGLNFAKNGGSNCSWCKYLSCLPVNGWCDANDLTTSSSTSS